MCIPVSPSGRNKNYTIASGYGAEVQYVYDNRHAGTATEFYQGLRLLHPKQYDAVVTALSSDRPATFRVNRLKTTPEVLLPALETQGFAVSLVPWSSDAFI